jgi:hypothetical protein
MKIALSGRRGACRLSVLFGICVLTHAGCGGDDDAAKQSTNGVTSGSGGGSVATQPFPAHTAGKACSTNTDCAGGTCQTSLPGTTGLMSGAMATAPDGYCTTSCATSADCGDGGSCIGATMAPVFPMLPGRATGRGAAGSSGSTAAGSGGTSAGGTGGMGGNAGARAGAGGNRSTGTPGICYASCTADTDCRTGYRCNNALGTPFMPVGMMSTAGTCQVAPATDQLGNGVVGSMCGADTDCEGGRCSTMSGATRFPGGYCSGRCLSDSNCGSTGWCSPGTGGGTGTCYRQCESDTDCGREGYRCRANTGTQGAPKRCIPGAAPLPDNVTGNSCSADTDCGGAAMSCRTQTLAQPMMTLPGGYCTGSCVEASDCGSGGACVGATGGQANGNCFKACTGDTECRTGYVCAGPSGARAGTMPTVCRPPTPMPMPMDQDAGAP